MTGIFRTARAALPVLALQLQAGVPPAAMQSAQAQPSRPPRVSVLPVFFVPRDARPPTAAQHGTLAAHLAWARRRYAELVGYRDSFAVAPEPLVYGAREPLAFYRGAGEDGAPNYVAELLRHLGADRFTCPYVLLVVVMNDRDDFPRGGGRPLNGGIGTGGGVVVLSSYALDRHPNFQSTLQHELGHAFGLVHVDEGYGEDMRSSRSLMSHNPAHHTSGFQASRTPGELLPVELVALSLNRRVFPMLAGDSAVAVSPGAKPDLVALLPMAIPGEPPNAVGTHTGSGERHESAVRNIVQGRIRPSRGPGITFDAATMWVSDSAADGWVGVDLVFPVVVTLTGLGIHTEHSGSYHRAVEARVLAGGERAWREVVRRALPSASCSIGFDPTEAREWRVMLRAGESGSVVVRGLEFRLHGQDVYPPLVREVAPAPPC